MNVTEAITSRHSVREFLDTPVSKECLERILKTASQAPSGGNLQPWWVHVVSGDQLQALIRKVAEKIEHMPFGEGGDYNVYPPKLKEPYRTRRFRCGEDLYKSISIAREDKAGRLEQFKNNFRCFGAPVAMFFTIDRTMEQGQWSDLGILIQTIMLLAREEGLHTCAQESWSSWSPTLTEFLHIPDEQMVFCGLAMGHRDDSAPINQWRTERAELKEFVQWHGL